MNNKHYIRVNGEIITYGFSDAFENPLDTDICITENGDRHFELLGETNPQFTNTDRTHRFRYVEVITEENVEVTEDVTDEVIVDTSKVTLDDSEATLSSVDVVATAKATGHKTIYHSNMIVRYATEGELSEELATIPKPECKPTEFELLKNQVDALQLQNEMLIECVLEMSTLVYGM